MDEARRQAFQLKYDTDPLFRARVDYRRQQRQAQADSVATTQAPVVSQNGSNLPIKQPEQSGFSRFVAGLPGEEDYNAVMNSNFVRSFRGMEGSGFLSGFNRAAPLTLGIGAVPNQDPNWHPPMSPESAQYPPLNWWGELGSTIGMLVPLGAASSMVSKAIPFVGRATGAAEALMAEAAKNPSLMNLFRAAGAQATAGALKGVGIGAFQEAGNQAVRGEFRPEDIVRHGGETGKMFAFFEAPTGLGAGLGPARSLLTQTAVAPAIAYAIAPENEKPGSAELLGMAAFPAVLAGVANNAHLRRELYRRGRSGQTRAKALDEIFSDDAPETVESVTKLVTDNPVEFTRISNLPPETPVDKVVETVREQAKARVLQSQKSGPVSQDPNFGKQPMVMRYPSGQEVVISFEPEAGKRTVRVVRQDLKTGKRDIINYGVNPQSLPDYLSKKMKKGLEFVQFSKALTPERVSAELGDTIARFAENNTWAEEYGNALIDYYTGVREDMPVAPAGDQAQALQRKIRKTIGKMAREYDVEPTQESRQESRQTVAKEQLKEPERPITTEEAPEVTRVDTPEELPKQTEQVKPSLSDMSNAELDVRIFILRNDIRELTANPHLTKNAQEKIAKAREDWASAVEERRSRSATTEPKKTEARETRNVQEEVLAYINSLDKPKNAAQISEDMGLNPTDVKSALLMLELSKKIDSEQTGLGLSYKPKKQPPEEPSAEAVAPTDPPKSPETPEAKKDPKAKEPQTQEEYDAEETRVRTQKYNEALKAVSDGRTREREAVISWGRSAGISDKEIAKQLLARGIPRVDLEFELGEALKELDLASETPQQKVSRLESELSQLESNALRKDAIVSSGERDYSQNAKDIAAAEAKEIRNQIEQKKKEIKSATEESKAESDPYKVAETWQRTLGDYENGGIIPVELYDGLQSGSGATIRVERNADGKFTVTLKHKNGGYIALATNADEKIARDQARRVVDKRPTYNDLFPNYKKAVEQAVKDGKPVPPEVIAQFPDLAKPDQTKPKAADLVAKESPVEEPVTVRKETPIPEGEKLPEVKPTGEVAGEDALGTGEVVARKVPVERLVVKPSKYQARHTDYSEETVNKIVKAGYSDDLVKVLDAFKDPETGEIIVLDGHSRLEASKRLGVKELPVRLIDPVRFGKTARPDAPAPKTAAEIRDAAELYAKMSNELGTPQSASETLATLRRYREQGVSDTAIEQIMGPTKFAALDALSHLKTDGKFLTMLNSGADIVGKDRLIAAAKVAGRMRRDFPDKFGTVHEEELFDYMTAGGKVKDISMKKLEKVIRERLNDPKWKRDNLGDMALNLGERSQDMEWYGGRSTPRREDLISMYNELKERRDDAITDAEKEAVQAKMNELQERIRKVDDRQETLGFDDELHAFMGFPNPEMVGKMYQSAREGLSKAMKAVRERFFLRSRVTGERLTEKDAKIIATFVGTPAHTFGTFEGQNPRFGEDAKAAQTLMMLTERDIRIRAGSWQEKILHGFSDIKKAGLSITRNRKKIVDWIEGDINDVPKNVREGITKVKEALEDARISIRDAMRERTSIDLMKDLVAAKKAKNGLEQSDTLPDDVMQHLRKMADDLSKKRIPDDWGLDDYFPHMFIGDYRIFYDGQLIGSATTRNEAISKAHKNHIELGDKSDLDKYEIKTIEYKSPEILRLADQTFARLMIQLKERAGNVSTQEIKSALSGVAQPKSKRNKYFGNVMKREGKGGYDLDPIKVLELYTMSAARYIELSKLSRTVQPTIDAMRSRGQHTAAEIMERSFQFLWGRGPTRLSRNYDSMLNAVSKKIGYEFAPNALDRHLSYLRGLKNTLFLQGNPGFHIINSLQPVQTLRPLARDNVKMSEASKFLDSKEGQDAIEKHNVRFFLAGKFGLDPESQILHLTPEQRQSRAARIRQLMPETNNQLVSWSYMYLVGKKRGMSDTQAADYAFIEGNVGSQFLALASNAPAFQQNPVTNTVFQWRRFPVQNIELMARLVKSGNVSGSTKWFGAIALLGGTRAFYRTIPVAAGAVGYLTAQNYQHIKDEYGEDIANVFHFGLPSLVGIDLSYSMSPFDVPSPTEALGVEANIAMRLARAYSNTQGYETKPWKRMFNELKESTPVTKNLQNLFTILEGPEDGKYNIKDEAGRVKYSRDLAQALKALSGRPLIDESTAFMVAQSQAYIVQKMDEAADNIAVKGFNEVFGAKKGNPIAVNIGKNKWIFVSGKTVKDTDLFKWNEDHPNTPITEEQIFRRQQRLLKDMDKTSVERMMSRGTKATKEYFESQLRKLENDKENK